MYADRSEGGKQNDVLKGFTERIAVYKLVPIIDVY